MSTGHRKPLDILKTYPTFGISCRIKIGNIVPPMEDPSAVKPNTRPLLLLNQCPIIATIGPKHTPDDT